MAYDDLQGKLHQQVTNTGLSLSQIVAKSRLRDRVWAVARLILFGLSGCGLYAHYAGRIDLGNGLLPFICLFLGMGWGMWRALERDRLVDAAKPKTSKK